MLDDIARKPRGNTATPTLDALRSYARERLAAVKLPDDLWLVDELAVTAVDEIDRRALRRSLGAEDYDASGNE